MKLVIAHVAVNLSRDHAFILILVRSQLSQRSRFSFPVGATAAKFLSNHIVLIELEIIFIHD